MALNSQLQIVQMKAKRFVLKQFPSKQFPQDLSCFNLIQEVFNQNQLKQGFSLIKIYWISLDPLLRTWISGARSYFEPVTHGSGIPGFGIGKIIKINGNSDKSSLSNGDWVMGALQWSQLMIIESKRLSKLPFDLQHQQYKFLTTYGPTGFTSYYSIKQQIMPFQMYNKKLNRNKTIDELNIVVSSAAGGVGLTLIQYLYKLGYRNIYGIAGSQQKCQKAKEFGCKDAINYKKYYKNHQIDAGQFEKAIFSMMGKEQVDIYYQNVGEDMLSSLLRLMADHSKIILCGALATYNNWNSKSGIRNYQYIVTKRIQMKGILYFNLELRERVNAFVEMINLQIKGADVIIHGIQKLPQTYRDMIDGKFIGKPIVQLFKES